MVGRRLSRSRVHEVRLRRRCPSFGLLASLPSRVSFCVFGSARPGCRHALAGCTLLPTLNEHSARANKSIQSTVNPSLSSLSQHHDERRRTTTIAIIHAASRLPWSPRRRTVTKAPSRSFGTRRPAATRPDAGSIRLTITNLALDLPLQAERAEDRGELQGQAS
jgi:hypothetical protein